MHLYKSCMLGLWTSTWEFLKIGSHPHIDPRIIGVLLKGHPQKGPPICTNSEIIPMTMTIQTVNLPYINPQPL